MRIALTVGLSGAMAAPALAADINLNIEIPRLSVAEYHRPYVAIWLERADNSVAANLAVWYDVNLRNSEGTKWLKDLRQWWRRTGRELTMPADGLTSPTRAPGKHDVPFAGASKPLADLPPGEYQLVIEAAREVGGRELLRIPMQWPPKEAVNLTAKGEHELGAISVTLKP
jgi:hypothetical protein